VNSRIAASLTFALLAGALANTARATPRSLPFTYPYDTLPEGSSEIEQYVDYVPTKVLASTGSPVWYGVSQFQTEYEYGITDRLELGIYATFVPSSGEGFANVPTLTEGNGMKQRLRLRLAEAGEWPVDTALYFEVVENQRELELEGKIILERRFGDLRAMANLVLEREFYFNGQRDWVINPTAGLTYQVTSMFHPGIEGWLHAEYPDSAPHPRPFALGPHVYVGPVAHVNFGRLWCSSGVYLRATDTSRDVQQGDGFARVWLRSVIGLDL